MIGIKARTFKNGAAVGPESILGRTLVHLAYNFFVFYCKSVKIFVFY